MGRYFFHLRDDVDDLLDLEGMELPDEHAARSQALKAARDTLSHEMKSGCVDLRYRIDVEDDAGRLVHSLPFAAAFEVLLPEGRLLAADLTPLTSQAGVADPA